MSLDLKVAPELDACPAVVIVDDNDTIRTTYSKLIRHFGGTVKAEYVCARDFMDAIPELAKSSLIYVLDNELPMTVGDYPAPILENLAQTLIDKGVEPRRIIGNSGKFVDENSLPPGMVFFIKPLPTNEFIAYLQNAK